MSTQKTVIELSPKGRGERESLTAGGFTCPYCLGAGKFYHPESKDDYAEKECECCQGSGKLKAYIEIAWLTDKSE